MGDPTEHLRRIRQEADAYAKESLCGLCADDARVLAETAALLEDRDRLMLDYVVRTRAAHPRSVELPKLREQAIQDRAEVLRRLGGPPESTPDRSLLPRPREFLGIGRSVREDFLGFVPRVADILPGPRSRRDVRVR